MTREHKPDTIIFVRKAINILRDSRRTSAINESLTKAKYISVIDYSHCYISIHFFILLNTKKSYLCCRVTLVKEYYQHYHKMYRRFFYSIRNFRSIHNYKSVPIS